jgi:phosphatidylserine/phosphatidylglycerophosphate/cardiolipin synthase-like enzyme
VSGLADQIRSAATHLPPAQLNAVAAAIAGCPSPAQAQGVRQQFAHPLVRSRIDALVTAWQAERPDMPGGAIALALLSAAAVASESQASQSIDPVWTGPATIDVPVRQTALALLDLVASASQRLILVSFAAYKVPVLLDALRDADARGVDIRLVLETVGDSAGALSVDAGDAFGEIKAIASFWAWPFAKRPLGAKLHAKAAIADESMAFVASANLTGAALEDNMELGLLVRGGSIPRQLARHFMALMDRGDLERRAA